MLRPKLIGLLSIFILLAACAVQQTSQQSSSPAAKTESASTAPKTSSQQTEQPTVSEPKIKSCELTGGKVVVFYDNGQKESFKPFCPEKDIPAFQTFIQEYYCDNLTVKSKFTRCLDNKTCYRGECI